MVAALRAFSLASLLLVPLLAFPGRGGATETFSLPAFVVGSRAAYATEQGNFTYVIEGPERTVDAAGRPVDVFVINATQDDPASWLEQRVSLSTLTLENAWGSCASATINPDGSRSCLPFGWIDWRQGSPDFLDATLLQGRSFHVGDAWAQEGACLACASPTRVAIEPPGPDSPSGTSFVAVVTADAGPLFAIGSGRLHMSADSPFPLLAQLHHRWGSVTARLVAAQLAEGQALPESQPPAARVLDAPLRALPYDRQRPVEGVPLPGWPSWSDARAATGPDAGDDTPGAAFLSIAYPTNQGSAGVGFTNPLFPAGPLPREVFLARTDSFTFRTEYALPGDGDAQTDYTRTTSQPELPDPLHKLLDPPDWQKTTVRSTRPFPQGCANESAPLWDLVRQAESTGLIGGFSGFSFDKKGASGEPDCEAWRDQLVVLGDTWGSSGVGLLEELCLDVRTGFLLGGIVLPH